jgi:hypothetical protein
VGKGLIGHRILPSPCEHVTGLHHDQPTARKVLLAYLIKSVGVLFDGAKVVLTHTFFNSIGSIVKLDGVPVFCNGDYGAIGWKLEPFAFQSRSFDSLIDLELGHFVLPMLHRENKSPTANRSRL